MQLYDNPASPFCRKVQVLLRETGQAGDVAAVWLITSALAFRTYIEARRQSFAGRSTMVCVFVTSWIVVMEPCLIPSAS